LAFATARTLPLNAHCHFDWEGDMKTAIHTAASAAAVVIGLWSSIAAAATLIADDEAQRPDLPPQIAARAVSRGPTVAYLPPGAGVVEHTPFEFKVKLEAHGGASITPAKVRLTYLKMPGIDLTERVRAFITTDGIVMPAAEAPAGEHLLRLDIEDSEGRTSQAVITLLVAKRTH
jgi:hypothetical protein